MLLLLFRVNDIINSVKVMIIPSITVYQIVSLMLIGQNVLYLGVCAMQFICTIAYYITVSSYQQDLGWVVLRDWMPRAFHQVKDRLPKPLSWLVPCPWWQFDYHSNFLEWIKRNSDRSQYILTAILDSGLYSTVQPIKNLENAVISLSFQCKSD